MRQKHLNDFSRFHLTKTKYAQQFLVINLHYYYPLLKLPLSTRLENFQQQL